MGHRERGGGKAAGCGIPEFKFQIQNRSKEDKARLFQGCGVEAVTVLKERMLRERVLGRAGWLSGRAQGRTHLSLLEDLIGRNTGSRPLGGVNEKRDHETS